MSHGTLGTLGACASAKSALGSRYLAGRNTRGCGPVLLPSQLFLALYSGGTRVLPQGFSEERDKYDRGKMENLGSKISYVDPNSSPGIRLLGKNHIN